MSRLELKGIQKRFGGVTALRDVGFDLESGEVHALVGENGAGKSTLIKVIAGVHQPDAGSIVLDGREVIFSHPSDATAEGIAVIYQELAQYPDMSVLENLFINSQDRRGPFGLIDWRSLRARAAKAFDRLGVDIDLDRKVSELSTAQGQLIEIARALTRDARFVVMDEPTASLTEHDTHTLYEVVRRLRDSGVGVVYISHRLEEIFEIGDRVTVLRDGESVGTAPVSEMTQSELVERMVGRELDQLFPQLAPVSGETLLEVRGLSRRGELEDIDLTVRAGEIVGLAGLVGAGRSELARAIFGLDRMDAGEVRLAGEPVPRDPRGAIAAGIALVSEDRKLEGVILPMTIAENISLPSLPELRERGLLNRSKERQIAERYFESLQVRAPGIDTVVGNLSGGNQQKVVLAMWLATRPKLLILDEPTRGIDVGAKSEIHRLMVELCEQGMGILMISSELPEVLGMSHRIVVMAGGRVAGELSREQADQRSVMELAAGAA